MKKLKLLEEIPKNGFREKRLIYIENPGGGPDMSHEGNDPFSLSTEEMREIKQKAPGLLTEQEKIELKLNDLQEKFDSREALKILTEKTREAQKSINSIHNESLRRQMNTKNELMYERVIFNIHWINKIFGELENPDSERNLVEREKDLMEAERFIILLEIYTDLLMEHPKVTELIADQANKIVDIEEPGNGKYSKMAKEKIIKIMENGLDYELFEIMSLKDARNAFKEGGRLNPTENKKVLALAYIADTINASESREITPKDIGDAVLTYELGTFTKENLTPQEEKHLEIIRSILSDSKLRNLIRIRIEGATDATGWRMQNPETKRSQELYKRQYETFKKLFQLHQQGRIAPPDYLNAQELDLLQTFTDLNLDLNKESEMRLFHTYVERDSAIIRNGGGLFDKALALQRAKTLAQRLDIDMDKADRKYNLRSETRRRGASHRTARASLTEFNFPPRKEK